jgi:hypothetical protein
MENTKSNYTPSPEFPEEFVSLVSECVSAALDAEALTQQITQLTEDYQFRVSTAGVFKKIWMGSIFGILKDNIPIAKLQLQRSKIVKQRWDPNYKLISKNVKKSKNLTLTEVMEQMRPIQMEMREYHAGRLTAKGVIQIQREQMKAALPMLKAMGALTIGLVGATSALASSATQDFGTFSKTVRVTEWRDEYGNLRRTEE